MKKDKYYKDMDEAIADNPDIAEEIRKYGNRIVGTSEQMENKDGKLVPVGTPIKKWAMVTYLDKRTDTLLTWWPKEGETWDFNDYDGNRVTWP